MSANKKQDLPLILPPEQLVKLLPADDDVRIVDLGKKDQYLGGHIPGAVYVDYVQVIRNQKPVFGLMPSNAELSQLFSALGITADTHVIAYDEEGGGKAGRFLWTLEVCGHKNYSLLDGGFVSWLAGGFELSREIPSIDTTNFQVHMQADLICDRACIMKHLNETSFTLLDCRSAEEFSGQIKRASRGGHIPGAVNLDWMLLKDQANNLRLVDDDKLKMLLQERDIRSDAEIVLHCHSHHRSALAFMVLKKLGYTNLRAYPGSWSDWAHAEETPVTN